MALPDGPHQPDKVVLAGITRKNGPQITQITQINDF